MKKILICCLFSLLITACDNDKDRIEGFSQSSDTNTKDSATKTKKEKETELVRALVINNFAPFNFEDKEGNLVGIDIEIINAIAKDQGFDLQLSSQSPANVFEDLKRGYFHMVIGGTSYTEKRAKLFDYTKPYLSDPSMIIYHNVKLNIQSLEDIQHLKVGILSNSRQMQDVDIIKNPENNLFEEKTAFALYKGLLQGKYDVILVDRLLFLEVAKNHSEHTFYSLQYQKGDEPSAQIVMYVSKNKPELTQKLNQGLEKLSASGELDKIKEKYIGKIY